MSKIIKKYLHYYILMRCFVAVDVPEELKTRVKELQDQLSSCDIKLVEPKNLHFTLKFLGEIDQTTISKVKQSLSKIATETKPISILLSGVGVFPNLNYIRVIWIGSKSQDFANLHKSVADALQGIGEPEKEAVPHLTVARVRSPRNKETIANIVKRYESEPFGSFNIDQIKLKKSTLMPSGPIYEDLEVFELK